MKMAIRDQRIDIGYGIEKVWRVVYDDRSDSKWRMQTGYVQYDNNRVPVWRPYDPDDSSLDAAWRGGVWRNVHMLVMPHDPAARKVRYQTTEHDTGTGDIAILPKIEVKLTFALVEHLTAASR
jgi:hypothetical protein